MAVFWNIYVCYVEKLIWHAPSLPPWKVSTCKATSLVVVVHSTNEVSAWLWCSVYLNISYCFYWQTQHMVWIFSIIFYFFCQWSAKIHNQKSENSTHLLPEAVHLVSSFEGAVKYNNTYMHVYWQLSEMFHIYMNTAEFFTPQLTSCFCTLDALFKNRPEKHSRSKWPQL